MKQIRALHEGTCRRCQNRVRVGDWIDYYPQAARGKRVEHVACPTEPHAGLVYLEEPYRETVCIFESVCPLCGDTITPGMPVWYYEAQRVATHRPGGCTFERGVAVPGVDMLGNAHDPG